MQLRRVCAVVEAASRRLRRVVLYVMTLVMSQRPELDFARHARGKQFGFAAEIWAFLLANKKWWLTPIALTLLLLGILIAVGGTAAAPFIYTLF